MELFYLYLLLSIILFVISILTGVEFLISGDDYAGTRFLEFIAATVVTALFCLGHYISARVKEKQMEPGKNINQHPPSR